MKPKTIKFEKGMPISTPGFADLIAGMKKAWDTLSVNNGYVSWSSDGRPKIISNGGGGGASITATSGAVIAKIMGGDALSGYSVRCYPTYPDLTDNFNAMAFIPTIALGTYTGSQDNFVLIHYLMLNAIGGNP